MNTVVKQHPLRPEAKETKACKSYWFTIIEKLQAIKCFMIASVFHLCFRFGRKKIIIGSLILAAVSSIGAVLLTTEDDSNKGKCFIERDSNFVSKIGFSARLERLWGFPKATEMDLQILLPGLPCIGW